MDRLICDAWFQAFRLVALLLLLFQLMQITLRHWGMGAGKENSGERLLRIVWKCGHRAQTKPKARHATRQKTLKIVAIQNQLSYPWQ